MLRANLVIEKNTIKNDEGEKKLIFGNIDGEIGLNKVNYSIEKIQIITDINKRNNDSIEIGGTIYNNFENEILNFIEHNSNTVKVEILVNDFIKKIYKFDNVIVKKYYKTNKVTNKKKSYDKYSLFLRVSKMAKREYQLKTIEASVGNIG